jgi:hypothetical protein
MSGGAVGGGTGGVAGGTGRPAGEHPPWPVRPLPSTPSPGTEAGAAAGVTTRIVIVATVILGQLFALTVALESSLLDHDAEAWLLAAFSLASFAVVVVLTRVDPPPRAGRLPGRVAAGRPYVPRPVEDGRPGGRRPE